MRTRNDRLRHAIGFELIGLLIAAPLASWATGIHLNHMGPLAIFLPASVGISALQIIREHQKIAFSDATRIRNGWMSLKEFESLTDDEKACIKSINTKQVKRIASNGDEIVEEFVKIECYDKQKSLDSIMNMLGYAAPKEVKLSGKIENPAVAPVVIQIDAEDALSIEKTPPADASSA